MTAKDCIKLIDDLQQTHQPKLISAKKQGACERSYWEGYCSALTMVAVEIEKQMKGNK